MFIRLHEPCDPILTLLQSRLPTSTVKAVALESKSLEAIS